MNKKGLIILIVFLSAICLLMTGGFIYLLSSNFEWGVFNFYFSDGKLVDSVVYENDVESFTIDSKSIDVYVEEAEDNNITLEVYSNNKNIDYSFSNENKKINFKAHNNSKNVIWGFNGTSKIVVKLPKEINLSDFLIDAKVGDIKVGNFDYLNGKIVNTTGDLEVKGFNNLNIDLNTGDIKLGDVTNVTIKHGTGDIDINTVYSLTYNGHTGDIDIDNVTDMFNITATTGDIKINNAELNHDSKIDHKTGDIRIKSLKNAYVDVTSKVGDVKVNNNDRYAELTCTIKNNVGDIRIN